MYSIIQKINSKERGSSDTESEESNHRHTQQEKNGANRSQGLMCPWGVVVVEKEGGNLPNLTVISGENQKEEEMKL